VYANVTLLYNVMQFIHGLQLTNLK